MKKQFHFMSLIFAFVISSILTTSLLPATVFARDLPDPILFSSIGNSGTSLKPADTFETPLYSSLFQPLPQAINQTTIEGSGNPEQDASRSFGFVNTSRQFSKYIVQPGDTLNQIANVFKIGLQELIQANHLKNPGMLLIGQALKIPVTVANEGSITSLAPMGMGQDISLMGAKTIITTLTAYTSGYESTGKNPGDPGYGITSTGTHATQGRTIAVDPHIIPYGSKVYIPGVGIRIAEDTGGAIRGGRIDVYFNDVNTALRFGVKRNIPVYILPNQKNFAYSNSSSTDSNSHA
ncbi:LysM peptidoglycan-binding domain-containing protein [Fodinisporobacter ferrooxydans]|uniref:LysM peptidoglycan-binding domain-containing protein n=1 Tax=Fodinisporobacter ferrooxydans TaxID=2901836 RepID=A0ABY4CJ24_9BACL|nr:LysM peptidoglycan-binding domain-containing protein [Alicyclobacillaceae bacterium MYW30-H2]